MNWKVGEAKQSLSRLLEHASEEPQKIYRRDRFIAAVISADLFEQFEQWRAKGSPTLGEMFSEVRELAAQDDYELEPPLRENRDSFISDE